jgi:spore maturation protein A
MKVILVAIPLISMIFGIFYGNTADISATILENAGNAVTLAISLCGIMCFWCGIMRVAEESGLVAKAAKMLSAPVSLLFRGLAKDGKAMQLICMNLAANILGLGNATTPLGIKAMQAIAEESANPDGSSPPDKSADDNMIMLAVLNTASLQLVPTTTAALRLASGAENPMDILPCVWIVSVYGVCASVTAALIMRRLSKRRRTRNPRQT